MNIEGVETEINSSQFWVSKDEKSTKFANYDGELSVKAGGKTVTMKANQGSVVRKGKASLISKLLPKPVLIMPSVFARIYDDVIDLEWKKVKGAKSYWLEIAHDKGFNEIFYSRKDVRKNHFKHRKVKQELYYWRVAAIDKYGLPGPKSEVRLLAVLNDVIPPYLLVNEPAQNAILTESDVVIRGETEHDATIWFGDDTLKIEQDGSFSLGVTLSPGKNIIEFDAIDLAGNVSAYQLTLNYIPPDSEEAAAISSLLKGGETNAIAAKSGGFTLRGKTKIGHKISIFSPQTEFKASTIADSNGVFNLNVLLAEDQQDFILTEQMLSGVKRQERFTVVADNRKPDIHLESPLPQVTGAKDLSINGRVLESGEVVVNGVAVELENQRFDTNVPLKTGMNKIRLEAEDDVHNVTIIERSVIRDDEAPQVLGYNFSRKYVSSGESVSFTVRAADFSGMKRAAPFKVKIGKTLLSGFLTLDRAGNTFEAGFTAPENVSGKVKLVSLTLEDYFGNRKEYKY